ncbi:MAG: NAD-dependent epimerase/dehydratase family protein [Thermoguttaceae bacterium]|nr:NAD-dependent epimerase/dehydratase family protein [Thermoguttaceae bacterium]
MIDKSKKIFITGATGFIGTTLVRQLLGQGYSLHTLSRSEPTLPPGFADTPETLWKHPNLTHFRGDVCDIESLRRAMDGCKYVIHLAGYAKNYAKDVTTYTHINIEGMRNVFIIATEQNIEKIVWTSTIVTLGPTRRGEVGDENMPRITDKCLTEYERTKTVAEAEAFQWCKNGLPLTIVNPTRVYGPGHLSEGNSLALLIDDYMHGRLPFLLNAGINVGNYVLVDDLARGIFLALDKGHTGRRYILGGQNATLKQFFQMIDKVTGKKHWKIPVFRPGAMVFATAQLLFAKCMGSYPRITPGWMRTFLTDWAYTCDRAKQELDYEPTPLEEGLARTCRWIDEIRAK